MGETLSDHAEVIMGQSPPGNACNVFGDGLPLLNGPTEFGSHHPTPIQFTTEVRKVAEPGDLLFCVRGSTTGRMNWADQRYAIGRGIAAIRHKRSDLNRIVRAVVEYYLPDLLAAATGSTFPNVSANQLNGIYWPQSIGGSETQIANFLSALDDKIELNRRANETLEAMAQALFRDWFVDFGPVKRKMEGARDAGQILGGLIQNPDEAAKLAALFPETLGDNGLPVGWVLGAARDLIDFNPKETLRKGDLSLYSDMSSLPTKGSIASPPIPRKFGSGMKFRNGDALLARITPCLENGKAAFVDFLPDTQTIGWGSTEFIVLRTRSDVPKVLAYCLTRHPEFKVAAIQSMTGTSGRQRAQASALAAYEFALPPNPILKAFDSLSKVMFEHIRHRSKENQTLAQTRDYLLPKLMSGHVRAAGAKAMVAA